MKSMWIILLLFSLFSFNSFASNEENKKAELKDRKKLIDSLYLSKSNFQLHKNDANKIINSYNDNIDSLNVNDLKALSVSYAVLNKPKIASEYLETYIKKSHDFNFLNSEYLKNIKQTPEFKTITEKYKPKFSFWFIIYFYVALVGIFISIILNLRKESDRIANLLISSFILLSSLFVIHICLYISNVQYLYPHTLFFTITFNFLYGPLLYFYFKRITEKYTFRTLDLLHLLPFLIFLLYFSRYYILPIDNKLHILLNEKETYDNMITILVIMKVISMAIYAILTYRIYVRASNKNLGVEKSIVKWQRNLVVLNIVYVFSHILYLTMAIKLAPINFLIHPQIISMVFFVLYVGCAAYIQPQIFNRKFIFNETILKYQKSGLTEGYSIELKEQLLKLLYHDKVFKENDISLDSLSERLGITRHSTSQVINEHFNMNFFNLINKFRLLKHRKFSKMTFQETASILSMLPMMLASITKLHSIKLLKNTQTILHLLISKV